MTMPTKEQNEARAALYEKITELVNKIDGNRQTQVGEVQRLAKAYALVAGTVSSAGE